jgi:integrase
MARPAKQRPEDKASDDRNQGDVTTIGKGEWQFPDFVILAVDSDTSRRFYTKYRVRNPDGTFPKKAAKYSIGPARLMTLADARNKALAVRRAALQGIDLKRQEVAESRARKIIPTFQQHANAWMDANLPKLKNANHRAKWRGSIAKHCGTIANLPINEITTADVMRVLEPIWHKIPVQASELRGRIEKILGHATLHNLRVGDNPARWGNNLEHGLTAPPASGATRGSHKSIDRDDMPAFMAKLRSFRSDGDIATVRCLEVTILTALRTQEVIYMRKCELDFDNARWIIPYQRFKVCDHGNDFDVPLAPRVVEVLRAQIADVEAAYGACDHVFPGRDRRQPISNATMLVMLQRDMGYVGKATVHGFRASFQTWAENQLRPDGTRKWGDKEIDRCLAHNKGVKSRRAYSRDTLFEVRKPIMLAWSAFLAPTPLAAAIDTNIVPITRRAG